MLHRLAKKHHCTTASALLILRGIFLMGRTALTRLAMRALRISMKHKGVNAWRNHGNRKGPTMIKHKDCQELFHERNTLDYCKLIAIRLALKQMIN